MTHEPDSIAVGPCASCAARAKSVCRVVEDRDLKRLAGASVVCSAEPGASFVLEGDPAEHFFNITDGNAKLYKLLPDGRRLVTGFARRGDFLGLAVSDGYAFSAEAIDHVRYCRFSRRKLEGLLDDFRALERQLLHAASDELVMAHEQMLLLGRKTAQERVATFLVTEARRAGDVANVALPMTRGDIADYLGLTIETVSRTLNRLKRDGVIALPTLDKAVVLNREALEDIAGAMRAT